MNLTRFGDTRKNRQQIQGKLVREDFRLMLKVKGNNFNTEYVNYGRYDPK